VSTGTQPRSEFVISMNADGTVSLDTVSGASQVLHATLKNMEILKFDNGNEVINLSSFFDTAPPTLVSSLPAANATGVAVGANIELTFSETIALGSGTVTLQNDAGQNVESYPVGSSSNLSISGNKLVINPSADLAPGGGYTLTVSSGALKDTSGNALAAAASVHFTTDPAMHVDANNAALAGTSGNDIMAGDARNNVFIGSAGKDSIDGGAGIDTLQLSGPRSGYTVSLNGTTATVSDGHGDTIDLANVERIQFGDATVALDISGNAGQVYRLYQAAFNRAPDAGGLGFWIGSMDKGVGLVDIASGFVNSAEFQAMYGTNPTNASIATTMYMNVLHRAPDSGGLAFWTGLLDNHQASVPEVLKGFSESAENQQNLIGIIGNGFPYTPIG
jgi:methionine-rich copper-binding protein CopC